MNEEERLRRTIDGQQTSSLEYVKYFCICDCLTLGMPEGYTAMGAGLELFINKFNPGEKYIQPFANKLPKGEEGKYRPLAYKIPKSIDAFIWSPFHDALSSHWDLGDGCRHAYRFKGELLRKLGLATRAKDPTIQETKKHILLMNEKIDKIWNVPKKLLVFYEHSRVKNVQIRKELDRYNNMASKLLDWPVLQVELSDTDAKDASEKDIKKWWGWEHYSKETYLNIYNEIKRIINDGT